MTGTTRDSLIREVDFLQLLDQALPRLFSVRSILREPHLGSRLRPDFVLELDDGSVAIVEAKSVTPATITRLHSAAAQLRHYAEAYTHEDAQGRQPIKIFAVPGSLSVEAIETLRIQGVQQVIDGTTIRAALSSAQGTDGLAEPASDQPLEIRMQADVLRKRLRDVPSGHRGWVGYQKLCGELLEFLFCPPLETPLLERSNESGTNRRDIILPNYALEGFWTYMRSTYDAHYVVADAKNYTESVTKGEILQLSNYLSSFGTGLFGMILTRKRGDLSADITRREQWFMHNKLILELIDEDLLQMITMKLADRDPAEVVRQKIEDFRLGF